MDRKKLIERIDSLIEKINSKVTTFSMGLIDGLNCHEKFVLLEDFLKENLKVDETNIFKIAQNLPSILKTTGMIDKPNKRIVIAAMKSVGDSLGLSSTMAKKLDEILEDTEPWKSVVKAGPGKGLMKARRMMKHDSKHIRKAWMKHYK